MAKIIDVRTPEEYKTGTAKKAVNLPLQKIEMGHMPKCDLNEKIIVFCRTGGRSAIAKELIQQHGYTNVENGGGLEEMI